MDEVIHQRWRDIITAQILEFRARKRKHYDWRTNELSATRECWALYETVGLACLRLTLRQDGKRTMSSEFDGKTYDIEKNAEEIMVTGSCENNPWVSSLEPQQTAASW